MLFLLFGAFSLWRVVKRRTSLPIDDETMDEV
jgi:hypothetical protein